MHQDIRKNDPFQPSRPSVGHVSRAGQFSLSSNSERMAESDERDVLSEASPKREVGATSPAPRKKSVKFFLMAGIGILFFGLLGSSVYFYYQYRALKEDGSKKEIALYLKQLEKIMVLPANETPTLATVTDKNKLSGQLFFNNAQNGDKVLVFSKAGKAVLYRPKENKIVEMMMLSGNFSETLPEENVNQEAD